MLCPLGNRKKSNTMVGDNVQAEPKWKYAGPREIHDATIVSVEEVDDRMIVHLKNLYDKRFTIVSTNRITCETGSFLVSSVLDEKFV
jgi:hypothetical protein